MSTWYFCERSLRFGMNKESLGLARCQEKQQHTYMMV